MGESNMYLIPDANNKIRELNEEIQKEQDPQRFTELVRELNRLLDGDGHTAGDGRTAHETARPPATSPKSEQPMGKGTPRG